MSKMVTINGVQVSVDELERALAEAQRTEWTGGDQFLWGNRQMVVLDNHSSWAFVDGCNLDIPDAFVCAVDVPSGEIVVFDEADLTGTEKL